MNVKVDEWGPEKIVIVNNKRIGLKGFLVIDNTAAGPGKGGIRMVPDVTLEEVARLARAMTWKNAMAGLPFGGAKAGIVANPHAMTKDKKMKLIRAFAKALKNLTPAEYIAGPDMNTGKVEMAIFADENGVDSCTGKPSEMGGLPHELGSTGWGVYQATITALKFLKMKVKRTTVAIEGFGNVGTFTAKFLSKAGARIVAVSDSKGTIYNPRGLDIDKLIKIKEEKKTVTKYGGGKILKNSQLFGLKVDVLIPGARPDSINEKNYNDVKAKLLVEAANIPIPLDIEEKLWKKKITIIPDFVANAGGVISSYVESIHGTENQMFKMVEEKITANTELVLKKAKELKISQRLAALKIAQHRVHRAMNYRVGL